MDEDLDLLVDCAGYTSRPDIVVETDDGYCCACNEHHVGVIDQDGIVLCEVCHNLPAELVGGEGAHYCKPHAAQERLYKRLRASYAKLWPLSFVDAPMQAYVDELYNATNAADDLLYLNNAAQAPEIAVDLAWQYQSAMRECDRVYDFLYERYPEVREHVQRESEEPEPRSKRPPPF